MENKIKKLFDYQKFRKCKKLDTVVEKYQIPSLKRLSQEELSRVNAAGDIYSYIKKTEEK